MLGDGTPLPLIGATGKGVSPGAVSYHGHIEQRKRLTQSQLTDQHSLVLFHYVTRSRSSFVERKIKLRGGIYATEFAALAANSTVPGASVNMTAIFDNFEAAHGFDGDHAICKQGARLAEALKAHGGVHSAQSA